jgi:hypothetical protein
LCKNQSKGQPLIDFDVYIVKGLPNKIERKPIAAMLKSLIIPGRKIPTQSLEFEQSKVQ